jgi:hypothetical protein
VEQSIPVSRSTSILFGVAMAAWVSAVLTSMPKIMTARPR